MARSVCLLGMMTPCALFLLLALLASSSSLASSAIVERTFIVKNLTVNRLCQEQVITAVNGTLPGPLLEVCEGDTVIVHVHNESPYNLTIHWHGIFQRLSGWADGPAYTTQCPIPPGDQYTYKFNVTKQEGTLWWHAHFSWLRATVYGGLIIRPSNGRQYPFPEPDEEVPIILGEWWNANVIDVENQAIATGAAPNISDAYTINGLPGDLYACSPKQTFKLNVVQGKTYLLRIVNAALNNQLFFKIASHNLKVVAVDASYTNHYLTDVVVVSPGQTTDVLLEADQSAGSYYMAASPYASAANVSFDNTTTTGIITYQGGSATSASPQMPVLPAFNDTPTANKFYTSLTGLTNAAFWKPVPRRVDHSMFITEGLGLVPCPPNATCQGSLGQQFGASMNNVSFANPTRLSMLEAFFFGTPGIYNATFPDNPPVRFNYTDPSLALSQPLVMTTKSTTVKKVAYNSTVQIVFQNTAFVALESHPIHLHGFNFHILAQGFGNYDPIMGPTQFNLDNPQIRNTVAVPVGGWAVIRFKANNPGVWLMHCHLDVHLPWGLATAFVVENGPTSQTTLPPPPNDLPRC